MVSSYTPTAKSTSTSGERKTVRTLLRSVSASGLTAAPARATYWNSRPFAVGDKSGIESRGTFVSSCRPDMPLLRLLFWVTSIVVVARINSGTGNQLFDLSENACTAELCKSIACPPFNSARCRGRIKPSGYCNCCNICETPMGGYTCTYFKMTTLHLKNSLSSVISSEIK
ncbi:uncharacterized protein [Dermacentor albipictus]|uniref:uncharacterized protein isoform X2 n=1 Tax=Dermacentor albipictus TaxID=60249 RepID=UPI0038FC13AA